MPVLGGTWNVPELSSHLPVRGGATLETGFARNVGFELVKVATEPCCFGANEYLSRPKISIHARLALGHDEIASIQMGRTLGIAVVDDWPIEAAIGQGELKIIGVQIAPYGTRKDSPSHPVWVATITFAD